MTAPHCRIGWVTPKNGGGRLRVLGVTQPKDDALAVLGDFVRSIHESNERPAAMAAIALWPNRSGTSLDYRTAWHSDSLVVPASILPVLAKELLARAMANSVAEYEILKKLGYDTEDPEGAA